MSKNSIYKDVTDVNGVTHKLPLHEIQAVMNDGVVIFNTVKGLRKIPLNETSHKEVNDFILHGKL